MLKPNKSKIILILIIILLIIFLSSIIFSILNMGNNNILRGISVDGIDVSNMSKKDAISKITNIVDNKLKSDLKVSYGDDKEINLNLSTLGVKYDINKAINEAYNIGREKNIIFNNYDILTTFLGKKDISLDISINEDNLSQFISTVSANIENKLVQSDYYIEDKELIITKGTAGDILQEEMFKNELYEILANFNSSEQKIEVSVQHVDPKEIDIEQIYNDVHKEPKDAYYEEDPFKVYKEVQGIDFDIEKAEKIINSSSDDKEYKIPLKYTKAKNTLEDLNVDIFKDLLGKSSTKYDDRNENRANNLKLAASKIDGIVLSPGEEFSYNKVVGERSISAGYKEAKIYAGGAVIDGLGGGICQISSTLYNAVMFANLKVTERHNHQFITSYVEAGRDATVAYGSKDFKFVNNWTYPIKINVSINSGVAKVEIYGIKEETEYNISFDIETVSEKEFDIKYQDDNSLEKRKWENKTKRCKWSSC